MSKISISSASITAPMGMVVSTAKVNADIQEPSLSRIAYRRDIRSARGMTAFETVKQSSGVESLKPSRKRRPKRQKRGVRSMVASRISVR